jgi:hypothetical protein
VDLKDYATTVDKSGRKRKRCITCQLDDSIIDQIHDARDPANGHPIPFPTIARWLESETGKVIQPNTIRNHFVAGHHND